MTVDVKNPMSSLIDAQDALMTKVCRSMHIVDTVETNMTDGQR